MRCWFLSLQADASRAIGSRTPAPPIQCLGAAHLHLDLFGMQDL